MPAERGPALASKVLELAHGHPVVDALLARAPAELAGVDRGIDADDEMLGYAGAVRAGDLDAALVDYFRAGLDIARAVREVAAWRFGGLERAGAVLDFASGWGRATRFLVRLMPAHRLWVADIVPGAIAFQAARFGVHGIRSTARAEDFSPPRRFDLIWVNSLFTHLPEAAFHDWLGRLFGCLEPGGLLAFSVHDPAVVPPREPMPESGFLFTADSESRTLHQSEYGSTWVTDGYVRSAVARMAPSAWSARLPRAIANFQDLYLVASGPPPTEPPRLEPGPHGRLDRCSQSVDGTLRLTGWVAPPAGGEIAEVRVRLGGELLASATVLTPRPDVVAGHPGLPLDSGWAVECAIGEPAILEIEAVSTAGVASSLFLGTLPAAEGFCLRAELEAERAARREREGWFRHVESELQTMVAEREARLEAMRGSRFWQARNAWFRVKRALGLTHDS